MTPKSISVIINTYNRRQSLAITLRSLAWLDYPHFEVIVVNGPSADDTEDFLNAFSGNMKVGSCENRNLSESRNVGVQMASGEIVAFIDDDRVIPIPAGSMQLTTRTICQKLGQPVVRWLDIRAMTSRAWYSLADRYGDAWTDFPPAINPTLYLAAPQSQHLIYTIGTNSSFRRDLLVALGGFDEEFEYYLEETDMCCRITDTGYVVRALDAGFVHHKFLPSEIREDNKVVKDWYQVLKSKFYFGMKHGLPSGSFAEFCERQAQFVDRCSSRSGPAHRFRTTR